MSYDIIGDIHGQAHKLVALLRQMGYVRRRGFWRHPTRTAIFVGDFIDRGPRGVETVQIVRRMVDGGAALAIMGNHELNAIAWNTPDATQPGEFLRPHCGKRWGEKNRKQHAAFLKQVQRNPALHRDITDWFLTLPLWLKLPGLRIVHACWHEPSMACLDDRLRDGMFLTLDLLADATREPDEGSAVSTGSSTFKAVETLTKGIEVALPAGNTFLDKDGHVRARVRIRWWDDEATTYPRLALLPDDERAKLPDVDVPVDARPGVSGSTPVFFGHYWMTGSPRLQSPLAVCVDYSAGMGGPLMAYRWNAGEPLSAQGFVGAG